MKMNITDGRFVGERLTEAREGRGLTVLQVSELLGIQAKTVSLYEKGKEMPSLEMIDRIATVLRFPTERFARPMPPPSGDAVFY